MNQNLPLPPRFDQPAREDWLALVEKDLKGVPFEKRLVTRLIEGLAIQPLYTQEDAPPPESMGMPGQAPFARGSSRMRAAAAAWLILPEHRHPVPSEANLAILSDTEHGAAGVLVRLSPLRAESSSTVGWARRDGVIVDSIDDFEQLFAHVDLTQIALSIAAGPTFATAASGVVALAERRSLAPEQLRVQFGADPLGTLAERGRLPRPAEAMLAEMADLARQASQRFPGCRAVSISTAPYDNAGATAVQELAAATATGVAYLRSMEDASLSVAHACRQLEFSLAVGTDQFLEIAKFRAMRMLWNRVLEAALVPESERVMSIHARTSLRILTQRDPWVNALRSTIGCFAAAVGGADKITILPYDDALGTVGAVARRLARNTQIVLQEEGHIGQVMDAAGGSYYVEHLTLALAEAGWKQFQELERRGGMLSVLRDGSFRKELGEVWQRREKDLARRKTPITGVSEYPNLGEKPSERAELDASQHELAMLERRARHPGDERLRAHLNAVALASTPTRFGTLVAAVKSGSPLSALQEALGKDAETSEPLQPRRFAAGYEQLRDHSDATLAKCGKRPRVFSVNMGPLAVHSARAGFTRNFFEAGGFEVAGNDGFTSVVSAVAAFATSGATTAIICSSDAWYDASACELGLALKQSGARCVILAGNPGPNEAKYRAAGIDQFIFIGCDVLGALTELARNAGVAS